MEGNHYLVPEVTNVLNWIIHSGVIVESESREFPRELAPLDLFGERIIINFCYRGGWPSDLASMIS